MATELGMAVQMATQLDEFRQQLLQRLFEMHFVPGGTTQLGRRNRQQRSAHFFILDETVEQPGPPVGIGAGRCDGSNQALF
jgi:hypothetical protein